ncbi:hypothetical protein GPN2_20093 [Streptomyces murinus]
MSGALAAFSQGLGGPSRRGRGGRTRRSRPPPGVTPRYRRPRPETVGMVLRTGWQTDPRALAGVVAAQLGQGVTAGRRLAAVSTVLPRLFADGPTPDELRDALPSLAVLAVAAVATAMPSASSTATSRSRRPSGQNCNGPRRRASSAPAPPAACSDCRPAWATS